MKTALLLLAVGLAAAVQIDERVYTAGREYVYSYQTQVVSGVPHHGVQASGVTIRCDVRIQFKTKTRALMKLENIQVFSILGEVHEPWPADGMVPEDLLTPVENKVLATLTGELTRVVKLDYENGKVVNVKMEAEPLWSINIKKAILTALKLNLNRENEIASKPHSLFDNTIPDWDRWMNGETSPVYKVMESGIAGVCESAYSVIPDPKNPDMLLVTKVRNYDNCAMAPVYEQGLLSCLTFIPEPINIRDMIQKTSNANYRLTGDKSGFVIQSAVTDSSYIITPVAAENGNAVTNVIQILTLKNAKNSADDIKPTGQMTERPNGIVYEWPQAATEKAWDLDFEGHFGWADMHASGQDTMTLIDEILNDIASAIHPIVTKPAVMPIKRVAGLMKTLSVEQLETLATKYTDKEFRKRAVVLDLLPTLMTPKVMPVLVRLITENKISTTRAILSYQLACLTITPTTETLAWISALNEGFIRHPSVIARPVLYHTVIVNSASIVRRFISVAKIHGATREQIEAALNKHVADALTLYRQTTSVSDIIALVKAAANSGLASFLPIMEETITNKKASPILRRNAIAATAKMPRAFWPKIQKMLLPVYMDMTDDRQVREVAFISLIDTMPGPSVLQLIVNTQRNEKSFPVASLVYTYLCNVAKMTLPGLERLAMDVRRILPLVRAVRAPTEYWITGTQNYYFDTNCANKEMCVAMDMFKSSNGMELAPSVVQARVYLHILGKTMRPVEFHGWGTGISAIMSKLFGTLSSVRGPLAGKTIPEMIQTLLTPVKNLPVNLGDVANEINNIIEKLGILERPIADNLHLGFVLKLFGNEVMFIDITEETIREWVKTGTVPIIGNIRSFLTELRTTGLTFDVPTILSLGTSSIQVPTMAGVPLFTNITATAVTHLGGSVTPNSVGVMEAINYGVTGAPPAQIGFHADVKPSVAVEISALMGVDFSVMATGTNYKATVLIALPTVMDAAMNPATNKVTLTITPPPTATEVTRYDIHGSVFMYTLPSKVTAMQPVFKALDIWHPEKFEMLNIKYHHGVPYTGATLEATHRVPVVLPRWMPYPLMWPRYETVYKVFGSEPWQITIETCTQTPSACGISWNTFTVDPSVPTPTMVNTAITIGAKSWSESSRLKAAFNLAMGKDMWMHHIGVMAIVPNFVPVSTDVLINFRKLAVFRQPASIPDSPTPNLAVINMAFGRHKVTLRITPEDATAISIAPYVHPAYRTLMKSLLRNDFTITKERTATTETPIVLKVVMEPTNVDVNIIEWTGAGIYSAMFNIMTMLDFPYMPHIEVNPATVRTTNVEAHLAIYPFLQKVICVARSPNSKNEFVIDLPWFWLHRPAGKLVTIEKPWVVPFQPTADRPALDKPSSDIPRSCSLTPVAGGNADMMMTFDAAEFRIPALATGCEVLLARDCSRVGLFTVLAAGIGNIKTVKVLVHNHKVEVVPVTSWFSNQINIKADGRAVTVTEGRDTYLTASGENWAKVTRSGDWINIIISRIGLIVTTDTKNVIVKAGPFYKGHLCGLCGNSNYDMMDDYMGPDMVTNPNAAQMILKYVLPSATCNIEDVRKTLGVTATPAPRSCTLVPRTGVLTYQGKTCFTLRPVNLCPAQCSATEAMTTVTAEVYCRNPNNINTQRMVEESKVGVVDLSGRNADATLQIEVPTTCVPRM